MWEFRGVMHAHLISDHSLVELHDFAFMLGFPERAFQGDHYDIPDFLIDAALELGAQQVDSRELVRRLKLSGLRLSPKQRGKGGHS